MTSQHVPRLIPRSTLCLATLATPRTMRVQDPGTTTLVLLVHDLDGAAMRLPASSRQPVRRVTAYGGTARAMTVAVPGAHLVAPAARSKTADLNGLFLVLTDRPAAAPRQTGGPR